MLGGRPCPINRIIPDEKAVKSELRELVRKTIEETINAMLDEEADQLVGAGPVASAPTRGRRTAGHYDNSPPRRARSVEDTCCSCGCMRFLPPRSSATKRRETSVEEAIIIEMYRPNRRAASRTSAIPGAGVSAGTVSNLNDKAFRTVEERRRRPLTSEYPYVYVDGIYLKRSWGGSYENVAVMVAIGVNEDGYREVIGCAEAPPSPLNAGRFHVAEIARLRA